MGIGCFDLVAVLVVFVGGFVTFCVYLLDELVFVVVNGLAGQEDVAVWMLARCILEGGRFTFER